ncbi:MAG: hypothetical protein HY738_07080 [Bacteroidia bacterium]|nr:hypothetical protein [Bacteroidia bacterium]
MRILYDLSIRLYLLSIIIASLFNKKAWLWYQGRKRLLIKIIEQYQRGQRTLWIHCASLGEFEQSRPVIEEFKSKRPEFKIILTFFSPSGFEIRKNYEKADYIWYLPIDSKKNAKNFIDIVKPDLAVFVKYDLWYHYINTCYRRNIPVYVISANFRTEQVFFKWYGGWFRKILKMCRHIFVQNNPSKELLKTIGIENVTVAGDVRFDRVYATAKLAKEIPLLEAFKQGKKIFICGSTWEKDENVIIPYINTMPENFGLNFIIAPHIVKPDNITRIIKQISKM